MEFFLFAAPFSPGLLMCLIYLVLEGGRKSTKNGIAMGVTIGGDAEKKWQEHSFVRDNVREAIAENWSARLDES